MVKYLFLFLISFKTFAFTIAPSTPARTLNTNYLISATRDAVAVYTVAAAQTTTLISAQTVTAELRVDTNATPTTVCDGGRAILNLTLGVVITLAHEVPIKLICFVPRGNNVRIVTTLVGTPTATLSYQKEYLFNPEFDAVDFLNGFPFK